LKSEMQLSLAPLLWQALEESFSTGDYELFIYDILFLKDSY